MRLTRQITGCLAIGCAITFITVGVMAVWMADRYDRQEAASSRTMMAGHARSAWENVVETTNEYALRSDGLAAYRRLDGAWLAANIGRGVAYRTMAETIAILSPSGEVEYAWTRQKVDDPRLILSKEVREAALRVMARPAPDNTARPLMTKGPSGLLTMGVARLASLDFSGEDPAALPIVVVAAYLPERVQREGKRYLIEDLAVRDAPEPGKESRVLRNEQNATVGYLTWTTQRPGRELLKTILPPLAAALFLFSAVMAMIGVRARRLAGALGRAAQEDHLTGLDNRSGLNDFLHLPVCREAIQRGEIAVIYMDVNGFKNVNDTVGHQGGDRVVCEVAQRLKAALPEAHVARMGGDEFMAVLTGEDAVDAARFAERLPAAMQPPFVVSGVEFRMSCAVGYAQATGKGESAEELVRRADIAMYQAKTLRYKEPLAYQRSMDSDALEKKHFECKLRSALANDELRVVYQPIGRPGDLSVQSLEALVRWRSPELGDVSPEKFVAAAEETGLIREIGDFVLNRVCADLAYWPDLRVAVNVSPSQLREPSYVRNFRQILRKHGVRPDQIEIELTENVLLNDPLPVARKLTHLRRLGVKVALDDFGTGFSSIGSLRSFPLDRLKIDRSFISDVAEDSDSRALVHAFVAVADALRLEVVCEGVETQQQAQIIAACGAVLMQGYLLSRPLEIDEARLFLTRRKRSAA